MPRRSVQAGPALGGVGEVGGGGGNAAEELSRSRGVAAPLVEVGQGVPEAEVVGLGALDPDRAFLEETDGAGNVAAVGQGAGGHDAALGHDLGRGVGGAELV